jgi:hypothetical protein
MTNPKPWPMWVSDKFRVLVDYLTKKLDFSQFARFLPLPLYVTARVVVAPVATTLYILLGMVALVAIVIALVSEFLLQQLGKVYRSSK